MQKVFINNTQKKGKKYEVKGRCKLEIKEIATIHNGFTEKFGIPRQSGLVDTTSKIVFAEEYRNSDSLRGLEGYSHLWIIWGFSLNERKTWSPTVRPPLLGGNKRMGVFATRSPFRPNSVGLSALKLENVEFSKTDGVILHVSGADLLNGTPIYDIKPYLPYADSIPDAIGGFTQSLEERRLKVDFPEELLNKVKEEKRTALTAVLAADPRPSYQDDPERVYGMSFADYEIKFKVDGKNLKVIDIETI